MTDIEDVKETIKAVQQECRSRSDLAQRLILKLAELDSVYCEMLSKNIKEEMEPCLAAMEALAEEADELVRAIGEMPND